MVDGTGLKAARFVSERDKCGTKDRRNELELANIDAY